MLQCRKQFEFLISIEPDVNALWLLLIGLLINRSNHSIFIVATNYMN